METNYVASISSSNFYKSMRYKVTLGEIKTPLEMLFIPTKTIVDGKYDWYFMEGEGESIKVPIVTFFLEIKKRQEQSKPFLAGLMSLLTVVGAVFSSKFMGVLIKLF